LLRNDSHEIVRLKSYPSLLTLIIENLVENAIQFAGVENPFVQVICAMKNSTVFLKVKDNGQGINEEYVTKIYDMYFRANVSSRGNGLGLYIVKKALDKINGTIEVETILHSGTSMQITIPLQD
jgi:signal transduction histidine kinase